MSSKRDFLTGAVMAVALCVMCTPAAAQFSVSITADENGHATFTNTNNFFANLPFTTATDPGPGGLTGVVNYGMLNPPGLVGGDLVLIESGQLFSDVIRFDAVTGNGSFFFYSDQDGGVDATADVGLPGALNTNNLVASETSLGGGVFGVIYTPTAGQPGFVAGAAGAVTYTFISDVPEPAAILMMASGLALLFLLRRFRPFSVRS